MPEPPLVPEQPQRVGEGAARTSYLHIYITRCVRERNAGRGPPLGRGVSGWGRRYPGWGDVWTRFVRGRGGVPGRPGTPPSVSAGEPHRRRTPPPRRVSAPVTNVSALVLIYDIRGFTAATQAPRDRRPRRVRDRRAPGDPRPLLRAPADLREEPRRRAPPDLGDGPRGPTPTLVGARRWRARRRRARRSRRSRPARRRAARRCRSTSGIGVAFGEVSRSDDYYGVTVNLAARLQSFARPEGLALDSHRLRDRLRARRGAEGPLPAARRCS